MGKSYPSDAQYCQTRYLDFITMKMLYHFSP